jgi:hypothetical protein
MRPGKLQQLTLVVTASAKRHGREPLTLPAVFVPIMSFRVLPLDSVAVKPVVGTRD